MTYTPCATSWREQTGNIITFAQFEEDNILTKTRNDTESGDGFDIDIIMSPLLIKKEMDVMDDGNELDHDLISTDMLENVCDRIQYHPHVNQREARYKIRDHIRQRQS